MGLLRSIFKNVKYRFSNGGGRRESIGRAQGNRPRSNQVQNEQTKEVARILNLTKDQSRELHDLLGKEEPMDFSDILKYAKEWFKK